MMNLNTRTHGDIVVVELRGQIDADVAPDLRGWCECLGATKIAVVMTGITRVETTSLKALVKMLKGYCQSDREVRLAVLQQPVRTIFEMTSLDRVFELAATEEDVIAAFGGQGAPHPLDSRAAGRSASLASSTSWLSSSASVSRRATLSSNCIV